MQRRHGPLSIGAPYNVLEVPPNATRLCLFLETSHSECVSLPHPMLPAKPAKRYPAASLDDSLCFVDTPMARQVDALAPAFAYASVDLLRSNKPIAAVAKGSKMNAVLMPRVMIIEADNINAAL